MAAPSVSMPALNPTVSTSSRKPSTSSGRPRPRGRGPSTAPSPEPWPDTLVDLPEREPLIVKGTYAAALGAILAGCRHVFGYPITPSTEGAELMARVLPELDGIFVQAVSEVATVNMMYGAGGAGKRCMTFTSSPGFSLMLEGISYMIGAEVPAVFVNIMRGGPGLGNVGPSRRTSNSLAEASATATPTPSRSPRPLPRRCST